MTHRTLRLIVILATISIVGIVITQVYWVRRAFDLKEIQFDQTVQVSLQDVAEKISKFNKTLLPSANVVTQVSSDYYIVHINNVIDANLLEHYLKTDFKKHQIEADVEYGIYDCTTEKMVYGNYINFTNPSNVEKPKTELPKWDKFTYYFGVYFPNRATYLASEMEIWIFSSLILLVVIIFFSYTLFAIFEQKRLAEIQKDFIDNMTHEFKTPISTIAISADVLSNPSIIENPARLQNYVSIIKNENNRLKNQVERVLQLAKVEQSAFDLRKEKIDLHDFIKEVTAGFALKVKDGQAGNGKAGELVYDLQAENQCIEADKVHLTNILYNLIDNAIKYCEKAPYIVISTRNKGNKLILSIKDNGIGISEKHYKRIFEKFFRVSTGNLHDVKGFGIGLNYVKSVIKAHKWQIEISSKIGEGTEFQIIISK